MYINSTNDAFLKQVSALSPGFRLRLLFLSSAFLCPNEKLPRCIFLQQLCDLKLKLCLFGVNDSLGFGTGAQNARRGLCSGCSETLKIEQTFCPAKCTRQATKQ
jgi:hypothetical protein